MVWVSGLGVVARVVLMLSLPLSSELRCSLCVWLRLSEPRLGRSAGAYGTCRVDLSEKGQGVGLPDSTRSLIGS